MIPTKSVGFELRIVSNLFRRRMDSESNGDINHNVTVMHGRVIDYLMQHSETEVMQRDLERDFSIRKSTVSRAIKLMEKNGLIKREPVESDARLKRICFTDEAIKAQKVMAKAMEKVEQEATKGISQQELDVFFSVLAKIKENLES